MAFDFKKEYKEFYMPKSKPEIVNVPKANYIAVREKGDPNDEGGEYKAAIAVLYAIAYTIKMSKMGGTTGLMATMTTWYRHWRAFGGKRTSTG